MPVTLSDEQWANLVLGLLASSNGLAAMTHGAEVAAAGLREAVNVVNSVDPGKLDQMAVKEGYVEPVSQNRAQRRARGKPK